MGGRVESEADEAAASPVALHMRFRYLAAIDLRDAIYAGDVEAARPIARKLARPTRLSALSDETLRHVQAIPIHAQEIADSERLVDITSAFASLIRSCGDCHSDAEVRWSFDEPALPEGEELEEHMARHRFAVERMWEGLLIADEVRFDRGAAVLEEAPLHGDAPPDEEHPPGIGALAEELHRLSRDVEEAEGMDERAAIFGEMLVTCAACHQMIRGIDVVPSAP